MRYRIEWLWNGNWRQDEIPEWKDRETAKADAAELLLYARGREGCKLTATRVINEHGDVAWSSYDPKP